MKFAYKILACTIIIMAVALGFSGFFLVNKTFEVSMNREIGRAMDENSILQYAFEAAALNVPSRYDVLQDRTIGQIGRSLENGGQTGGRLLRISDENRTTLYVSDGFDKDEDFLSGIDDRTRIYQVIRRDKRYYVKTGAVFYALDRTLYLETMKDVTEVYAERAEGFETYRRVTLAVLALSSIVMFFIAFFLTRPIRQLIKATEKMRSGDFGFRAEVVGNDEMSQLTSDFNLMANTIEKNISTLEDEVRAREDFIAAFSHELKTPLTAIIGYADLLRSRKLDEEKHFLSANYIYTEGKRLETMAFRLLDIIVTKRTGIELQRICVAELFEYLREMYSENPLYELRIDYEPGEVNVEVNLMKSVLVNLVDNACKASKEGSRVEIYGRKLSEGYRISVKDYGVGIAPEEQKKILEAFYMVDKSRSRSRNGAGLGLTLCSSVLLLHDSRLEIESTPGEGSLFSFVLKSKEAEEHA